MSAAFGAAEDVMVPNVGIPETSGRSIGEHRVREPLFPECRRAQGLPNGKF